MRPRARILSAMIAVAAVAGPARAEPWKPYASGGFTVDMPGAPKETSDSVEGATMHTAIVEQGRAAWGVMWADLPASGDDVDAVLDGARTGAIAKMGGKLVGEKHVTVDGKWPARDLRLTAADDMAGRALIVLVGARLYSVVGFGPAKQKFLARDVDRFVASFHVTAAPPPVAATGPTEYKPADGSFVVTFPGKPREGRDESAVDGGMMVTREARLVADDVEFEAGTLEFPKAFGTEPALAARMHDGMATGGKLVTERTYATAGHPSFEIVQDIVDADGPQRSTVRCIVVGKRVFMVSAITKAASIARRSDDVKRFFESYRLLAKR